MIYLLLTRIGYARIICKIKSSAICTQNTKSLMCFMEASCTRRHLAQPNHTPLLSQEGFSQHVLSSYI